MKMRGRTHRRCWDGSRVPVAGDTRGEGWHGARRVRAPEPSSVVLQCCRLCRRLGIQVHVYEVYSGLNHRNLEVAGCKGHFCSKEEQQEEEEK